MKKNKMIERCRIEDRERYRKREKKVRKKAKDEDEEREIVSEKEGDNIK